LTNENLRFKLCPKWQQNDSKIMENNANQQKPTVKESQVTRKYRPSSLPLADLIRSINEANKPKAKVESSWQGEPEPPLAA
jgi:hypothetical protein